MTKYWMTSEGLRFRSRRLLNILDVAEITFMIEKILIPVLDFQAFNAFKLFLIVSDQGTVAGHCGCCN